MTTTTQSLPYVTMIGSIETVIAPVELLPTEIDAIVKEQDTQLLLDADSEIQYPEEDYNVLIEQMLSGKDCSPGQIITKQTRPIEFHVIIYNINQEPDCKIEWIAAALKKLMEEIKTYNIKTLAMPVLGTAHGCVEEKESLELLHAKLLADQAIGLQKLWLIAPYAACHLLKEIIEKIPVSE